VIKIDEKMYNICSRLEKDYIGGDGDLEKTRNIYKKMLRKILEKTNAPHWLSFPVLYN
jgi:hypothetical protein